MITVHTHLHKPEVRETKDFTIALEDTLNIFEFLKTNEILLNRLTGNRSADRQLILKDHMEEQLHYEHEKEDIFLCKTNYRVDFYKQTSKKNGIIVEVEGGGTLNNNHAMKDYEKTQACFKASYLILIVPSKDISKIIDRYEYKFTSPDHYDRGIDGLFIIGY